MTKMIILGAGESGVGAAILAVKQGYSVFVSDAGKIAEKYKSVLVGKGIEFEEGKHSEEKILAADEVMKSPGIPDKNPLPKIRTMQMFGRYPHRRNNHQGQSGTFCSLHRVHATGFSMARQRNCTDISCAG